MNNQNHTQLPKKTRIYSSGRRAAREILLLCTTANLSPERKEQISSLLSGNIDWKYLLDLAEFHGVAPLVAYNFLINGLIKQIPRPYSERLNNIYNNNLYRNVILSAELTNVLSAFSQGGIPVISLKGIALAEMLYENPALRTMSDIDILVQPDDLPQASSVLIEMGYKQMTSPVHQAHPFHGAPYYKQTTFPIFIELHWNLDDPRLVAIPHQEIWRRAQQSKIAGETVLLLSPEDALLFLSNHLFKHDNYLLRSLCDITELLKKYDGIMDWDYILKSAYSWQIETPAYCSLKRAQELLGAPVPESVIATLKPSLFRWRLLNFLIDREIFISTISGYKLRKETSALFRGLLMKHVRQTLVVLSRQHSTEKRWAWLSTVTWVALVFGAALGRNLFRGIRKGGIFNR